MYENHLITEISIICSEQGEDKQHTHVAGMIPQIKWTRVDPGLIIIMVNELVSLSPPFIFHFQTTTTMENFDLKYYPKNQLQ